MIVDYFVMWDSYGSRIHSYADCEAIPAFASMGAAMDRAQAIAAADIPLCGACCRAESDVRIAYRVHRDARVLGCWLEQDTPWASPSVLLWAWDQYTERLVAALRANVGMAVR